MNPMFGSYGMGYNPYMMGYGSPAYGVGHEWLMGHPAYGAGHQMMGYPCCGGMMHHHEHPIHHHAHHAHHYHGHPLNTQVQSQNMSLHMMPGMMVN
ncbi:hypothetical protein M3685_01655 [Heyndrickxia oleronia]|uniref:Uncharacterized protein n=1 Tax=Heyndrickxia oleronia TaxID=38875 RepID=A0AAW6SV01_9BACI|nr:hypothetical protein [Heyndrickxia oleronia]MCM3238960.1 hypothetical protein [Heyndrickxia oleronia]MCM3452652.1 hypothetical protein [Heyndrickxia oleronia]MDH5160707.1 hypothetical protein [Heyndrickxia oleronia]